MTDAEIRAYLDRNPAAFGSFLRREIRRDPNWWRTLLRREMRIAGHALGRLR